MLLGISKQSIE